MAWRVVKWLYFSILLAMTAAGAWAIRPVLQEQAAHRESPLSVHVYAHPFVSVLKDTPMARGASSSDFFSNDVFKDATAAIVERQAPPFAKGADRDAWLREFTAELTSNLNSFMARRYTDSLQRLSVTNDAKGMVLVRLANTTDKAVEEIRVEVAGGQLFMEGSPSAAKFRSLGTRALRLGTLGPKDKIDLAVLTTEDMSLGGAGPKVKVSAKNEQFPVIVHPADGPLWPALDPKWIAFAVVYLALILAGLGVAGATLAGGRGRAPVVAVAPASRTASTAIPAPPPIPLSDAQREAWRRPGSA